MEIDPRSTRGQLLDLLREGYALTKKEITERLPIGSERQARHLVRELREAGIEIQGRRRGANGPGRKKEYYLPQSELELKDAPVPLTEQQALALVVAAEAGQSALQVTPLAGPLEEGFGQLLDRLEQASGTYDLARLREQWHFGTEPVASAFEADVFNTLVDALNEGRPVKIEYDGAHESDAPRRRAVSPLVMAAPGGSWRCVAYCHYREAPRDFTLSRIEDISIIKSEVAAEPPDFDPDLHFRGRFGAMGGDPQVVRLLAEPEVARHFREKDYHVTQIVEEEREDGSVVVSFEVSIESISSWVLSWGPSVTVLSPEALTEKIREEAREVINNYQDWGNHRGGDRKDGD